MEQTRELYYYFGRNEAHDYVATPIDNVLIAGRIGTGKSVFLQSMLIRLIQECNPNEIKIYINDCKGTELQMWSTPPVGRAVPHIAGMNLYSDTEEETCNRFLENFHMLWKEAAYRQQECMNRGFAKYSDIVSEGAHTIVCIIDEYQVFFEKYKEELNRQLSDIITWSNLTGVYVVMSSQSPSNALNQEVVDKFKIGICMPNVSEKTSNSVLRNNCASMDKAKYGSVWMRYNNRMPVKLYVPFYPDTWILKFIGYSSVRKGL